MQRQRAQSGAIAGIQVGDVRLGMGGGKGGGRSVWILYTQ